MKVYHFKLQIMKILVVVPARNEEDKIGEVISDLHKRGYDDILVVDDGSSDRTGEFALESKAKVVRHVINRGLGAALGTGFEYARRYAYDLLITFDGDGQHQAMDLKKLIRPIIDNEADVVIGSRLLNSSGMPWDRKVINWLANILTLLIYRVWTTDSQSGLRIFNHRALALITIKTDKMEVSSEFFVEIKRNNLRFVEIPIEPIYTSYSRRKGQSNLNAVNVLVKMLLRLFN